MSTGDAYYEAAEASQDVEDESIRKLEEVRAGFQTLLGELPDLPSEIRAAVHDLNARIGSLYVTVTDAAETAASVVDDSISDHPWIGFWVGVGAGIAALHIFNRVRQD